MAFIAIRLLLVASAAMLGVIVGGMYALAGDWGAVGVTAVAANIVCAVFAPSRDELARWDQFTKKED
jgi:hypothetical protein